MTPEMIHRECCLCYSTGEFYGEKGDGPYCRECYLWKYGRLPMKKNKNEEKLS